MCGIAGIIHKKRETIDPDLLLRMAETLTHRGPDGEKFAHFDSQNKTMSLYERTDPKETKGDVGFAHRRLSIIDLSEKASQPMQDASGDLWVIHNGEIYNYVEIKEELKQIGHVFHTRSDTEVILNAYKEWGVECFPRFNGMWAFVLLDLKNKTIIGTRDRFGIKPLFYHDGEQTISFASEIKALFSLPWIKKEPFLPAIKDYLYFSRVDTSCYSFFTGIHKLEAGHYFKIDLDRRPFRFQIHRWWDICGSLEDLNNPADVFDRFRDLLQNSVQLRLRCDVPIGTCLSGGIDSSAIVVLANPFLGKEKQKSFSIVHPGESFDETVYIDEIAKRLGIESKKRKINGTEFLDEMPQAIQNQDEPFTSTSIYAQWKVFELARKSGVTVTLDGQGADELLAGYPYFNIVYWAELLEKMRFSSLYKEIRSSSSSMGEVLFNLLATFTGFLPHRKMISAARFKSQQYQTRWIRKDAFRSVSLPSRMERARFPSRLNKRLYEIFTHDGLPALLRYADRNSMAHGLESRMPFLDHRLVSFAFTLASKFKIKEGLSKYILRQAMQKDIPPSILNRRDKIPFLTPEADWFRNELKGTIQEILSSQSFKNRGFFNPGKAMALFQRHADQKIDASRPLWRIINTELWSRHYFD